MGGDDIIYTGAGNDPQIKAGAGNDIIIFDGCGVKTVYGEEGNDIFKVHPCKEKIHFIPVLMDFEINNPNEKIDFSELSNIKSLKDLELGKTNVNIDPSLNKDKFGSSEHLDFKEAMPRKIPTTSICWEDTDEYSHCIYLPDITNEQVYQHPENFIFSL